MKRKGTVLTLVNERELRNFKQLIAPLEIPLTEMYVFGGELTAEKPARVSAERKVYEPKTEHVPAKKEPSKIEEPKKETIKKETIKKETKPVVERPIAVPKTKKKNRAKNAKNKGARRSKEKE